MQTICRNRKLRVSAFFACAVVLSLTACGGGGGSDKAPSPPAESTAAQKLAALEASGALPKLDRSQSLGGTDVNGNGVRDDVEALVATKFSDAGQRAAAVQLASALQSIVLVNKQDAQALQAASRRSSRAINCIFSRFNGADAAAPGPVVDDLIAVTTNTKARLQAYLEFSGALDGAVLSIPEGDTCE